RLHGATAVGVPDLDPVDGTKLDSRDRRDGHLAARRIRGLHSDDGASAVFTPLLRVSIALTDPVKAFSSLPLPTVPMTSPRIRPLRFFPSRTVTRSTSVVPSEFRLSV